MITRILILFAFAAAEPKTYILGETDTIMIRSQETIRIDTPQLKDTMNMWVIGRFPSNKIVPNEGRLGDRYSERRDSEDRLLQTWTITCFSGMIDEVLEMDFWYLKPQYAEQYYNDPEAYEATHGEEVKTKIINFIVTSRDL